MVTVDGSMCGRAVVESIVAFVCMQAVTMSAAESVHAAAAVDRNDMTSLRDVGEERVAHCDGCPLYTTSEVDSNARIRAVHRVDCLGVIECAQFVRRGISRQWT